MLAPPFQPQHLAPAQSTDDCMGTSAFPHAFSGLQMQFKKLQRKALRFVALFKVMLSLHVWIKELRRVLKIYLAGISGPL